MARKKVKTMADNKKWTDAKDLISNALQQVLMDSSVGLEEYSMTYNVINNSMKNIEEFLKCFVEKN